MPDTAADTWQVLLGGSVIDGTGGPPIRDAAVVIEGERLRYVGPRAGASWPAAATVRAIDGLTVLPGLIDCHEHLAHTGLDLARRAALPYSLTVYETAQALGETLRAGVTSARDAGGLDYGAVLAVERGLVAGPRLIVSLSILYPTAGLGGEFHHSGLAFPPQPGLPSGLVNGVEDARRAVREMVAHGASAIKLISTGGISSPDHGPLDRQFTDGEVAAIVDEAHAWKRRVLCHAYGGDGAAAAIKAGVDSIDHGGYLHQQEDLLRAMADKGIFLVPTLSITEDHRNHGTPQKRAKAEALREHYRRTIERAFDLGVQVAMGTDASPYGHARNAREVRFLVEAGLTPMQALVASTATAAACIGLDADAGTLVAGKYADLVVVAGDPLTEIGLLEDRARFRLVMKGGTAYLDRA
jgi:imidazolonepropionase-like amidohydrolase